MPKSVYLAGPIAGLHHREADGWRQEARTLLNAAGLHAYSPLRYRYEHVDGVIHAGEYDHPLATDRAIHQRDRNDVRTCDLMLACFLGAEKGSLGTAVEFGWADAFGKLVVLVIEPQGNPHDHAILRNIAAVRVETVADACRFAAQLLLPEHADAP